MKAKIEQWGLFRLETGDMVLAGVTEDGRAFRSSPVQEVDPAGQWVRTKNSHYGLGVPDPATAKMMLHAINGPVQAHLHGYPVPPEPIKETLIDWQVVDRGGRPALAARTGSGREIVTSPIATFDPAGQWVRTLSGSVYRLDASISKSPRPNAPTPDLEAIYRAKPGLDTLIEAVRSYFCDVKPSRWALNEAAYDFYRGRSNSPRDNDQFYDFITRVQGWLRADETAFRCHHASHSWIHFQREATAESNIADQSCKFYITLPEGDREAMLRAHFNNLLKELSAIPTKGEMQVKFSGTPGRLAMENDTIVIHFEDLSIAAAVRRAVEKSGLPHLDRTLQGRQDYGIDDHRSDTQIIGENFADKIINGTYRDQIVRAIDGNDETALRASLVAALAETTRDRRQYLGEALGVAAVAPPSGVKVAVRDLAESGGGLADRMRRMLGHPAPAAGVEKVVDRRFSR
jgi:hypothetical protein